MRVFLQTKKIAKFMPKDVNDGMIFVALDILGSQESYSYSNYHAPNKSDFIGEILTVNVRTKSDVLIVLFCAEFDSSDKVEILSFVCIPVAALPKDRVCEKGLIAWLPESTILSDNHLFKFIIHLDSKNETPFSAPLANFKSDVFLKMKEQYIDNNGKLKQQLYFKIPPKNHPLNNNGQLPSDTSSQTSNKETTSSSTTTYSNNNTLLAAPSQKTHSSQSVERAAALMMEQTDPRFWSTLGSDEFIRACVELMVKEKGGIENQLPNVVNYLNSDLGRLDNKGTPGGISAPKITQKKRNAFNQNASMDLLQDFNVGMLPRLPESPPKFKITSDMPPVFDPSEEEDQQKTASTVNLSANPNSFYPPSPKSKLRKSISDVNELT